MINNYYEFIYIWGSQAIIFTTGVGLGYVYAVLKLLSQKKKRKDLDE